MFIGCLTLTQAPSPSKAQGTGGWSNVLDATERGSSVLAKQLSGFFATQPGICCKQMGILQDKRDELAGIGRRLWGIHPSAPVI